MAGTILILVFNGIAFVDQIDPFAGDLASAKVIAKLPCPLTRRLMRLEALKPVGAVHYGETGRRTGYGKPHAALTSTHRVGSYGAGSLLDRAAIYP